MTKTINKDPLEEIRRIITRIEQREARRQNEQTFNEVRDLIRRFSQDLEDKDEGLEKLLEVFEQKK